MKKKENDVVWNINQKDNCILFRVHPSVSSFKHAIQTIAQLIIKFDFLVNFHFHFFLCYAFIDNKIISPFDGD